MNEDDVASTLSAYEADVDAYVEKYRSMSVLEAHGEPFLEAIDDESEDGSGCRILDVGCGPGSDLEALSARGYEVIGLDFTASFLRAAAEHVPVANLVRGDMRELPLADDAIHGVWASASFLHVPRADASRTLSEFRRVLRPDGVLYLSVKRARFAARDDSERAFEPYDPDAIRTLLETAGLDVQVVHASDGWVAALATAN
ncbi:class I SAM-dependent methyltransferase [Natronosalvus vescus]|uniref:class I SAM-dependent methyltransferase n=1 Tax=Natronosalvus vescus TaxID=2953881 RepID=UPI0020905CEF|nr:class I SAM-dependent methyltransferase [Natronosalvus vescus]